VRPVLPRLIRSRGQREAAKPLRVLGLHGSMFVCDSPGGGSSGGLSPRNGFDLLNPLCEDSTTRQAFSVFVSLNGLSDVDRESRCQMKKTYRYLEA
jgi:hypothetical protein